VPVKNSGGYLVVAATDSDHPYSYNSRDIRPHPGWSLKANDHEGVQNEAQTQEGRASPHKAQKL